MINSDKMKLETPDLTAENIAKLAAIFPGVVAEGKVNVDLLRSYVGEEIFTDEAYEFTWVGKRAAIAEAGRPIRKTLRPCPEESRDWDTTKNLYIEGDNLDVLKLLQESYLGKVKMVYIDPPYNTGNDKFLYRDKFEISEDEYEEEAGVFNENGDRQFSVNTTSNPRFHSRWCSEFYPTLVLARHILSEDGIIAVSIGDKELMNAINLLNEVFGYSNQVCIFTWKSRAKPTNAGNAKFRPQKVSDYVLVYSRTNPDTLMFNVVPAKERVYPHEDEGGKFRLTTILTSNRGTFRRETMRFESGGYQPDEDYRWKAGKETIDKMFATNHIALNESGVPMEKKYESEESDPLYPIYSFIDPDLSGTAEQGKAELSSLVGNRHGFDTVKPVLLLKYLISTFSGKEDMIVDFYSGSSTTAQAVMELNAESGDSRRKFIMVQVDEPFEEGNEAIAAGFKNICEIGKERIRRAGDKIQADTGLTAQGLDIGFRVLKLDDTNMNEVYYAAGDLTQDLVLQTESNIKSDRTDMDLLFGCLLDWGLPLTMPHTHENIDGFTVHTYNGGDLIACFKEHISEKAIREIATQCGAPERRGMATRAVFRDNSFTSSPEKINVFEIFKLLAPNTSVKVI